MTNGVGNRASIYGAYIWPSKSGKLDTGTQAKKFF